MTEGNASSDSFPERIRRFALTSANPASVWRRAGLPRLRSRNPQTIIASAPLSRREVGARGEKTAALFLKRHGYRILEQNFRSRYGEIDIIAKKDKCLVFVEVRTRRCREFGTPEESVTPVKRERLAALAESYLQGLERMPSSWRIDLVAVELARDGSTSRVRHIENAID